MIEKQPTIFQRLNEVRRRATYIQKRPKRGGMKFPAVAHADLIRKVRLLFIEYGILWFPVEIEVLHRERLTVPRADGGERTVFWTQYRFVFRFQNVDDAEDFIDIPAVADGMDDSDKGAGKASTYADKTALIRALNLETGEDPDFDMIEVDPDIEPERLERIDKIKALAAELVPDDAESVVNSILTNYGERYNRRIVSLVAMPLPVLDHAITQLEKQIAKDGQANDVHHPEETEAQTQAKREAEAAAKANDNLDLNAKVDAAKAHKSAETQPKPDDGTALFEPKDEAPSVRRTRARLAAKATLLGGTEVAARWAGNICEKIRDALPDLGPDLITAVGENWLASIGPQPDGLTWDDLNDPTFQAEVKRLWDSVDWKSFR